MINNNPGGRLWVDPDGVEGLGKAYDGHVQLYETYLAQLTALRARYANAWGDDDMGEQFSTKFLEGMDNLEAIIGGVKGTLKYTAEGLKESGRAYREADEEAAEVSRKMAKDFDGLARPVLRSARAVSHAAPVEGETQGELRPAKLARRALAPTLPHEQALPLGQTLPHEQGILAPKERLAHRTLARAEKGELLPQETGFSAARPAMPAISAYYMKPEYATAYVGGQPLPEGYRLISLNTFEDGTSRVDANLYDSITPLAGTPVTTPDGTPVDRGDGQLFVVKENPAVDPTADGYEPLLLSYAPDGTPTPLIAGF